MIQKKTKSLTTLFKLQSLRYFFLFIVFFSSTSFADCYSKYSKVPKKIFIETLQAKELLGIFYGCYREDVLNDTPYIPLKNCVDQSKRQLGIYDIVYTIDLDEEEQLFITVNDPFIGKERKARVRKICINNENELQLKTRFIKINLKQINKRLELNFRFLFKRYFQILKKKEETNEAKAEKTFQES